MKRFFVAATDNDGAVWFTVDARSHTQAIKVVQEHLAKVNGHEPEDCPFTINICIPAPALASALVSHRAGLNQFRDEDNT